MGLSVCLSVPYRLNLENKTCRKTKIGVNVLFLCHQRPELRNQAYHMSNTSENDVYLSGNVQVDFRLESKKVSVVFALLGGRPHNKSALGLYTDLVESRPACRVWIWAVWSSYLWPPRWAPDSESWGQFEASCPAAKTSKVLHWCCHSSTCCLSVRPQPRVQ